MLDKLINEFLTLNSPEIKEIKENATILQGFLALAKKLESNEKVEKRFYEWSRSFYQATAVGESFENLENVLKEFFGLPIKPRGKGLPFKLRLSPSVKQLNGIKNEQVLYIKKLNVGEFYGALFPWQKNIDKSEKIEIHLGFSAQGMTEGASAQLANLTKKYLSQSTMTQIDLGVGGAIHGISLPSFLQMSEMEGSTFKLKITSKDRIGYLQLNEGKLVGAQVAELTGKDAAYRIISWDNVVIEIENNEPCVEDDIQQPLMHVLMESLKIKDETNEGESESAPDGAKPPPPPQESPSKKIIASAGIHIAGSNRGPFERVAPPAPIIAKKKSKAVLVVMGLAISLPVLLVIFLVGSIYLKKIQLEAAYQEMIMAVEGEIDPHIKEKKLIEFLDRYEPKNHLAEIESQIRNARQQIEKKDYETLVLKIGSLPINDQYKTEALKNYNDFLSKYPDSQYTDGIKKSIAGLDDLLDDSYYQKLISDRKKDLGEKFDAYQEYLSRFPSGRHRKDVETLLMDMGEQYFSFIKSQARVCDEKKQWGKCLIFCENYVKVFEKSPRIKDLMTLKGQISDKQQFNEVQLEAEKLGQDYISIQKMYQRHLADHPNSAAKPQIIDAIEELKVKVADQRQWLSLKNYAQNSNQDIYARLKQVEHYLDKNNKGTYSNSARQIYEKLLAEEIQIRQTKYKKASLKQADQNRQQTQAQRLALTQKISQLSKSFGMKVNKTGRRFRVANNNETFQDTVTGHIWALLDSNQHFQYCLNYNDAVEYAANLSWGGYSDWRLPTSQELASLYKTEPFFPQSESSWYWTSESYVKGYHSVANIVTSKQEKSFVRQYANQNACGAVRAIRP